MNKHKSDHHPHGNRQKRGAHKDWRTWAVVVLMLLAILAYVFSDDESLVPGQPAGQPVPAEAAGE